MLPINELHSAAMVDFEKFYRQHYQQLFSFGYQLCADKEMTKDALQEVFLIMWERKDKINQIEHLAAYLRKVTHRQIVKHIKNARRTSGSDLEIDAEFPAASYEEVFIGLETEEVKRAQLKKAMDVLSPTEKEMLMLKFYRSFSYDQIADQTGKSKQTIYNQVFKAIGKLKKLLNPVILLLLWSLCN